MKNLSLDDLQVFVAVAECGTLSEAARRLDASPATLCRRMAQLEDAMGLKLFHRHRSGYELTKEGERVQARLRPMTAGVREFERWLSARASKPRVRLSAGTWTIRFLAQRFSQLSRVGDDFEVLLLASETRLNIEQREIDIGLRNGAPTSASLAGRRLTDVAFAPFVRRDLVEDERIPWIAIEPDLAATPSASWVLENHAREIAAYANNPTTILDLIHAGVGVGVLPCFVGDSLATLRRHGPVIETLTNAQHIVFHNETRHDPHIRTVGDRIVETIRSHADLYAGRRLSSVDPKRGGAALAARV